MVDMSRGGGAVWGGDKLEEWRMQGGVGGGRGGMRLGLRDVDLCHGDAPWMVLGEGVRRREAVGGGDWAGRMSWECAVCCVCEG